MGQAAASRRARPGGAPGRLLLQSGEDGLCKKDPAARGLGREPFEEANCCVGHLHLLVANGGSRLYKDAVPALCGRRVQSEREHRY